MKKGIVAVVVVLMLVAAGMPIVNGVLMEKGFRKLVENVNAMYANTGTDTKLEIVRYERGLFSSEVEWKVDLGSLKTIYNIKEIVLLDQVKHGYKGVVSKTSLEKNTWYTDFVSQKLGGKNPVEMTTSYMLTGDIQSVLSMQPFSVQVDNETLNSKAGELHFTSNWDLEKIKASGTWEGFTIADKLDMAGVSFSSDLKVISSYIWDGKGSFQIDKVTVKEDAVSMVMDKLQMEQSLKYDEVKKTLAAEMSYGVGSISDGESKVEDGFVTLGARGLDAAAYEDAMKVYTSTVSNMLEQLGEAGQDQEKLMTLLDEKLGDVSFQMASLAEKFLKSGLEIYISNLHAKMEQGEVGGNILVRLEKDINIEQIIPIILGNPEQIFDYLSLKSDVHLPVELIGENPMLTSPIYPGMKTGLFVVDGARLVHKAETRDKKLFINGEELLLNQ